MLLLAHIVKFSVLGIGGVLVINMVRFLLEGKGNLKNSLGDERLIKVK